MDKLEYLENRINLLETYLYLALDIEQQLMPPEYQQMSTDLWNDFIQRQENLDITYGVSNEDN